MRRLRSTGAVFGLATLALLLSAAEARACTPETLVFVDSHTSHFKAFYQDSVINARSYAIHATCTASQSGTVTFTATGAASSEAGAIFAKVKVEVSASISKAVTSGFVTSADFTVPKHDTVNCDRGVNYYTIKGHDDKLYSDCSYHRASNWTSTSPTRAAWKIY